MLKLDNLLFILLSKNTVFYGQTTQKNKVTKSNFFLSQDRAQKWFDKKVTEWQEWSQKYKKFLQPFMLFKDFYTLSYPTIEYKVIYDPTIELYYFSLWVNKKILFHMLASQDKLEKKMIEMDYFSQMNNVTLKPFYKSKSSSDSSDY